MLKADLGNLKSSARKLSGEIITRSSGKRRLTQRGEEGLLLSVAKEGFTKLRTKASGLLESGHIFPSQFFCGLFLPIDTL